MWNLASVALTSVAVVSVAVVPVAVVSVAVAFVTLGSSVPLSNHGSKHIYKLKAMVHYLAIVKWSRQRDERTCE